MVLVGPKSKSGIYHKFQNVCRFAVSFTYAGDVVNVPSLGEVHVSDEKVYALSSHFQRCTYIARTPDGNPVAGAVVRNAIRRIANEGPGTLPALLAEPLPDATFAPLGQVIPLDIKNPPVLPWQHWEESWLRDYIRAKPMPVDTCLKFLHETGLDKVIAVQPEYQAKHMETLPGGMLRKFFVDYVPAIERPAEKPVEVPTTPAPEVKNTYYEARKAAEHFVAGGEIEVEKEDGTFHPFTPCAPGEKRQLRHVLAAAVEIEKQGWKLVVRKPADSISLDEQIKKDESA